MQDILLNFLLFKTKRRKSKFLIFNASPRNSDLDSPRSKQSLSLANKPVASVKIKEPIYEDEVVFDRNKSWLNSFCIVIVKNKKFKSPLKTKFLIQALAYKI